MYHPSKSVLEYLPIKATNVLKTIYQCGMHLFLAVLALSINSSAAKFPFTPNPYTPILNPNEMAHELGKVALEHRKLAAAKDLPLEWQSFHANEYIRKTQK